MLGLTFPGDRQVELIEFPDPMLGPGEMDLEIRASGMWCSDLHAYRRPRELRRREGCCSSRGH
jgi:threonine dehydrogenase-like Zn-dependent dehydrogenase